MKGSPENGNGPGGESRLESWKQIAAYLNRDVRTAHRWERNEGLPVHRHQHSKRGTVYAYPSEIDDWLSRRSQSGGGHDAPVRGSHYRALFAAGGAVGLLVVAALWIPTRDEPVTQDAVGILIPQSENRSGDARFDGAVDSYLRGELGNPRLQILSPGRISATLTLMREPSDRPLDLSLARELALRTPDVDLIVASTLERFGAGYVLTAELADASEGAVLQTLRSEAASEDELATALRDLAEQTRDAIDDIGISEHPWHDALEPVTTSSTAAARLYSESSLLMYNAPWQMKAAEEGLRRAIDLDPQFATACIQLAFAIQEQGRSDSDYLPFAERALALADSVTEPERLYILGSYHKLRKDLESAQPYFVTLNETYPDHFWGQLQMAELSHARRNLAGAAWSMALAADLKPRALEFQMTAFNFILTTSEAWNAARIRERLDELNRPANNGGVHPFMPAEFFGVNQHLLEGEAQAALDELNTMRRKLDSFPDDVWTKRSGYAARLAEVYLALGRLRDAEELLRIVTDDKADAPRNTPALRMLAAQQLEALLAVSRNEPCCDGARADSFRVPDLSILSVRSGVIDASDAALSRALGTDSAQSQILRAELARRAGDAGHAIALLSAVMDAEDERLRTLGLAPGLATATRREYFLAAASLADLLVDAGRTDAAIRVLARWSNRQSAVAAFMTSPSFAPYWTELRWRLASLYLDLGQNEPAQAILESLSRLLELADDDHYIASRLRARR